MHLYQYKFLRALLQYDGSIDVQSNLSPYPSSGRQVMNVNEPNTAIADCLLFSPDGKSIISGWYCLYSEADRQTDMQRERERKTYNQRDGYTYRQRDGQADLQTVREKQAGVQTGTQRKTDLQRERDRQIGRLTDRDRWTYRQTGKQTRLSDLQRERGRA